MVHLSGFDKIAESLEATLKKEGVVEACGLDQQLYSALKERFNQDYDVVDMSASERDYALHIRVRSKQHA
ncbi:MAG: hypothetical protein UY14_C0010G0001 [Parcubacteria group bacterium GW2011_GWA1_47_9]|nr:MAG: hypothetical protein UY14_C0010G0001 [Parcubacteria group bacterium GW2011_GWA1_47_9]